MCVVHSMSAPRPTKAADKGVEEEAKLHRIRITLTSRNVPNLEKGTLLSDALAVLGLTSIRLGVWVGLLCLVAVRAMVCACSVQ